MNIKDMIKKLKVKYNKSVTIVTNISLFPLNDDEFIEEYTLFISGECCIQNIMSISELEEKVNELLK